MTKDNDQAIFAADCTIYLLDDNDDFRATAKWWLGGAGYEVFDFSDPHQAIDALKALTPTSIPYACLLLDVRMPVMTGMQVHDELIRAGITGPQVSPALPIIYMTGHGDVPLAVQAMEKGAITFLEKPFQDHMLESALKRAFDATQRMPFLPPGGPAWPSIDSSSILFQRRFSALTPREVEVYRQLLTGRTSKMIARELGVTPKNVDYFRSQVMKKMQAETLVDLVRMALNERLIE
ncbi:MAG: response regulator [Burkholderiaceae bacterium]|jgi:FixJ family two-component response regulator|nr:response regulator [Burkholderiaceae bacterium]